MPASQPRPYHRASIFGDGPRVPLCREQLAQFRAKLKLQRRPGRVTACTADVGEALADMLGKDGQLDPTIETIASRAHVSVTACKDALARLRAFGFLDWSRRLIRNAATGWRAEQRSNAYVLRVPACEVGSRLRVSILRRKKAAQEQGEGWEEQRNAATRQLLALGFPIPDAW